MIEMNCNNCGIRSHCDFYNNEKSVDFNNESCVLWENWSMLCPKCKWMILIPRLEIGVPENEICLNCGYIKGVSKLG